MGRAAPGGVNPGGQGGVPSPAQHPGPRCSADGGPGARKAYVPLLHGRGALRASGSLASPRVQVHPRGWRPRLWGRVTPALPLRGGSGCPAVPRTPLSSLPGHAGLPAWGANRSVRAWLAADSRPCASPARAHGLRPPKDQRGGSAWKRSPTSSPRCSEWNLESAGNCSNTQPEPLQSALALLKRSSSHQSLASPSPRKSQVCKEGCRDRKSIFFQGEDVGDGARRKMGAF